jgi:hypothetical protein
MTDFDLEEQLAELDSDEGTNFGLPFRPMRRGEIVLLVAALIRPS